MVGTALARPGMQRYLSIGIIPCRPGEAGILNPRALLGVDSPNTSGLALRNPLYIR